MTQTVNEVSITVHDNGKHWGNLCAAHLARMGRPLGAPSAWDCAAGHLYAGSPYPMMAAASPEPFHCKFPCSWKKQRQGIDTVWMNAKCTILYKVGQCTVARPSQPDGRVYPPDVHLVGHLASVTSIHSIKQLLQWIEWNYQWNNGLLCMSCVW